MNGWLVQNYNAIKNSFKIIILQVLINLKVLGRNLFDLSDEELKNDMGIVSVGHRKNIMKSI